MRKPDRRRVHAMWFAGGDHALVLHVRGDLDAITTPWLATQLEVALDCGPRVLILDLSEVNFISAGAIRLLMETRRMIQDSATVLRVAAGGAAIMRPMRVIRVDTDLDLYPTLTAAVRGRGRIKRAEPKLGSGIQYQ